MTNNADQGRRDAVRALDAIAAERGSVDAEFTKARAEATRLFAERAVASESMIRLARRNRRVHDHG